MLAAEDINLYDEAEEFINKLDRIKSLHSSLFLKNIEGMNVSSKESSRVVKIIHEAIDDCFWESMKNAKRTIDEINRRVS